ncbi:hypothetical protein Msi02_47080 [Microbispora siamensis]|uniref:Uncharacterized protein n=1 Tax=Microbispora siamensis TaxID=564413 RepID=A0ABQ4GR36_9ACTN|nr:hypothetical protein Msi02_47080 [Microbispora siamensis]
MARTDGRASVTHIPKIRKGGIEMAGNAALLIDMTRSMCPIQGVVKRAAREVVPGLQLSIPLPIVRVMPGAL